MAVAVSAGGTDFLAIAVLSGVNHTVVSTYDVQMGHLLGQTPAFPGSPVDMAVLSPDSPGDLSRGIVTASSDGSIRRFHHLQLVWEMASPK